MDVSFLGLLTVDNMMVMFWIPMDSAPVSTRNPHWNHVSVSEAMARSLMGAKGRGKREKEWYVRSFCEMPDTGIQ